MSGTVVEAGADFRQLVGREVIVPAVIPCGSCDLCKQGRGNVCRAQLMPGNDVTAASPSTSPCRVAASAWSRTAAARTTSPT